MARDGQSLLYNFTKTLVPHCETGDAVEKEKYVSVGKKKKVHEMKHSHSSDVRIRAID